eukprot:gnl/MRDRNA2_/MRDRNA2_33154_c0_seq1.p1 gnl/MRDRNA2_/MRDRNA2_33154_c0~~gnl/MRDRNA2_/MRDRNA2_33154_c0_seq1.p1  ORF type:complete len:409 (-),score=41.07 gnl/MRDRNA2_/MRDRNA2_33154_c0_seq1:2-1228(-)
MLHWRLPLTLPALLGGLAVRGGAEEMSRKDLPREICTPLSTASFLWPSPFHRYRLTLRPDDDAFSGGSGPELQTRRPLSSAGICDVFPSICAWVWECDTGHCRARCSWWSRDKDCEVDIPPSGGCIQIIRLAKGAEHSTASWELGLDLRIVLHIIVGASLFWGRRYLRENTVVHAFIGAVFIVMLGTATLMYFVFGQTRKMASGIPLLGYLVTLSPLLILTAPSWYLWTVAPTSWRVVWSLLWPWLNSFMGLCLGAVVAVFGARFGLRWFASDSEEPTGEVEFTIGHDGRRVDKLPPDPWQQRMLGFLLGATGVALLLCSTHDKYLSGLLLLLVLLKNSISQYIWDMRASQEVMKPEYFRSLMSKFDFEEEGYKRTSQALTALREYASSTPEALRCLKDDESELRFRR